MLNSINHQSRFHGIGSTIYDTGLCITVYSLNRLVVITNIHEHHLLFIEVGNGMRVLAVGSETFGTALALWFQGLESQAHLSLSQLLAV